MPDEKEKKLQPYVFVAYKLKAYDAWRVTSATDFDNTLSKRDDVVESKRFEISKETGDVTVNGPKKKTK